MEINIGDSFIDSEDVVSRLEKLRNKRDELTFIVYRVRNDETIETFDNKNEADEFVDEEDYDPERVKVRMTSKGLDDDDEEELSDLEIIDRDGSDIFSDWGSIFQGERMTAALLDRFTHRCHIFEINGESYRFRESAKAAKEIRQPEEIR